MCGLNQRFPNDLRPERPTDIPADCEEKVILFLHQQRGIQSALTKMKAVEFGRAFEKDYSSIVKLVIRAATFISAERVWKGKVKNPSQYETIFGQKWAAVAKKCVSRRNVVAFAKKHEGYLLWLASHGPVQPNPTAQPNPS